MQVESMIAIDLMQVKLIEVIKILLLYQFFNFLNMTIDIKKINTLNHRD